MDRQPTEIRQEQIAHAVLRLVERDGFKGLSIAKVAHEVGVVPSALYRHYANKEEMLTGAVQHLEDLSLSNLARVRREYRDPVKLLEALLFRQLAVVPHMLIMPKIMFAGMPESERLRVKLNHFLTSYLAALSDELAKGQQLGLVHAGIDPPTTAMMIWGLMVQSGVRWYVSGGEFDREAHLRRSWAVLKRAIVPEE